MAKIFPADWNHIAVTGAALRKIETLEMLRAGLPNHYAVYHGVHWTRPRCGFSIFREADFIVVSPAGRLVVIEQESGFLEETPDGLVKVSYHQLCVSLLKPLGISFDFADPAGFSRLEAAFAHCELPGHVQYDVLIVDEGQDTRHDEACARYLRACGPRSDREAVSLAIGTKNVPSHRYSSLQVKELFKTADIVT